MSQIEVLSAVHGIAPRSDELLKLGGDVERGRVSQDVYGELLSQEEADWLKVQSDSGINLPSNGKLDWQDPLRPIVKASFGFADNIDEAPVTRWFETNTFYRRPTIVGHVALRSILETDFYRHDEHVSLIAPYTFANLCDSEVTTQTNEEQTANLYKQLLNIYRHRGAKRVTLKEYYRQYPAEERPWNNKGVGLVADLARDFPDVSFGYLAADRQAISIPRDAPPNLGVSISPTTINLLGAVGDTYTGVQGRELWVPVVLADTTLEDRTTRDLWNAEALRALEPSKLVLTHNVDFQHIPQKYAYEKIKWLAEEARLVQKVIGGEL